MRINLARAVLLATLIVLSGALLAPARAQTEQPAAAEQASDESITVTGQLSPTQLGMEIRRFVRGHARLSRIDQLTRWMDPVCPRVLNLPDAYGAFIVERVKTVAREAGAPVSDAADCTPNITVMFTTEPQAVLDDVRANNPVLLGAHFISNRDALARMTRPIQGWYVTATGTFAEVYLDEAMRDPPSGVAGSRLTRGLHSLFLHALIIVDQNRVAGAEIGPISDYVAMIALSEIREESWACGGLVTIMELFSTDCGAGPQTLTTPDRAFLQGLYTMDEEAVASIQRGHIAGRVSDAVREDTNSPTPNSTANCDTFCDLFATD
jgi:hypothetical protein